MFLCIPINCLNLAVYYKCRINYAKLKVLELAGEVALLITAEFPKEELGGLLMPHSAIFGV